jgi:hypothetical protein
MSERVQEKSETVQEKSETVQEIPVKKKESYVGITKRKSSIGTGESCVISSSIERREGKNGY